MHCFCINKIEISCNTYVKSLTFSQDNEENRKKVICLNNLVQEEFLVWQRLQKTQACLMTGIY